MSGSRPNRLAVTGAAGSLAGDLLPGLVRLGYHIVAIDRIRAERPDCEWISADITDRHSIRSALRGCDAVVHLAGIPLESEWDVLLRANIDGTQSVLDAAVSAGVRRVVLASSIHAAGYVPVPPDGGRVPDDVLPRPDTFYGVSKAAVEALGSLYHDRYGLQVVCLRIASRFARPRNERMLHTWLSPADALRLVDAALTTEAPGFRIVWGVSANTRGYLATTGGTAIGFRPADNAERYADTLRVAESNDRSVRASEWDRRYIGGVFCSPEPPRAAV